MQETKPRWMYFYRNIYRADTKPSGWGEQTLRQPGNHSEEHGKEDRTLRENRGLQTAGIGNAEA